MNTNNTCDVYDVIVVGAGPAGLSAAIAAANSAAEDSKSKVLLIERDKTFGGILNQCIHNGFGLHLFKKDLTGPEYAEHFIKELKEKKNITSWCNTFVLEVLPKKDLHEVVCVSREHGLCTLKAKAIVLAMGCRERTRGHLALPGTRPAGIFTAGTAQRLTNIEGLMPGRRVVILGSGDIGMIMARRLTLEGAKVEAVVDRLPYVSGLTRNRVQCVDDFNIPLYLNHTVTFIKGNKRVEAVEIADVNDLQNSNSRRLIECDTLLLSVGLIPENELTEAAGIAMDAKTAGALVDDNFQTSIPGIFACGNVLHVSDLVDYVSSDAAIAGCAAAHFAALTVVNKHNSIKVTTGENVTYSVPQMINIPATSATSATSATTKEVTLSYRVKTPLKDVRTVITNQKDGKIIFEGARKKIMRPGEMERVKFNLNKDQMEKIEHSLLLEVK
ncbi:MAG: FAD-dependent oxidoreductase [Oligoflexia bacterium]|nr:FAD-dependent oxidoreductase [Oligoflexia bacterium]